MGILLPVPNALELTRNPGAACRRLYSLIRIRWYRSFTIVLSAPFATKSAGLSRFSMIASTRGAHYLIVEWIYLVRGQLS